VKLSLNAKFAVTIRLSRIGSSHQYRNGGALTVRVGAMSFELGLNEGSTTKIIQAVKDRLTAISTVFA
jgi:hypothetical protein